MNPVEIIKFKRDKKKLTNAQIKYIINGYISGEVADYQMSAFLMAAYLNGMDDEETFALTECMLYSGEVIDLKEIQKPKIDKHSIGGVGDKTSLILAPVVAACGIAVPMISGRGLGHTGGTLDKLESIPGFRIDYDINDYKRILKETGLVMSGQTGSLAPADKKIYALRDVTGTVDNESLITASIMSKKLAEGAEGLVFDIKIGSGSNLQDEDRCKILTKKLLGVSSRFGKKAIAVATEMDEPLGMKIGNWLEVEECIELMTGKIIPDLYKINNVLAGAMIHLGGKAASVIEGEKMAEEILSSGEAYDKFIEMVKVQNGDVDYVKDWKNLKRPEVRYDCKSDKDGFIGEMNAYKFGMASIELGCGRKKILDKIDYLAGIELNKKCGQKIEKGETIYTLYAGDNGKIEKANEYLSDAVKISEEHPAEKKLIKSISGN